MHFATVPDPLEKIEGLCYSLLRSYQNSKERSLMALIHGVNYKFVIDNRKDCYMDGCESYAIAQFWANPHAHGIGAFRRRVCLHHLLWFANLVHASETHRKIWL